MDDFYKGLVESLEQAREKKSRLLKELEVTDFLIEAQEQAIAIYGKDVIEITVPKLRARRGDKLQMVVNALQSDPFGITRDELFEKVKDHGIDRNYFSKLLLRLKDAGRVRLEGEVVYWDD